MGEKSREKTNCCRFGKHGGSGYISFRGGDSEGAMVKVLGTSNRQFDKKFTRGINGKGRRGLGKGKMKWGEIRIWLWRIPLAKVGWTRGGDRRRG